MYRLGNEPMASSRAYTKNDTKLTESTAVAGGPLIGITMGDPAGVGPEIICRALAELPPAQRARIIVYGDIKFLQRANTLTKSGLSFSDFGSFSNGRGVSLVHIPVEQAELVRDGMMNAAAGTCSYAYIKCAVVAALAGKISIVVTAPINKEALHAAGHPFEGHTELLAHLTGAKSSFMLLASEKLSTIHVSTHVSLAGAIARATTERELETMETGHGFMQRLGIANPRIAVAGLNPHCGENGLFGTDEPERIVPAIEAACRAGIDVRGPIPGDTVFLPAGRGGFALVVA